MAIYFAGYLSPIRNKLGNAVGRKWRTLDVLSVYNGRPRNPRSTAQQNNRLHFGTLGNLAMSFAPIIELGYTKTCEGTPVPPRSYFVKENWGNVTIDTPGNATIDYTEIVCGKGTLIAAGYGNASFADPLGVEVPLTNNAGTGNALATDKVALFVYSPEAKAGMLSDIKTRADESVVCAVPADWVGHRVHVYAITFGAANTDNEGKNSVSRYLGSGTIS